MKPLLCILFALTTLLPCAARTFTVAPGGDDGHAGTIGQPWEHVQHAADVMIAGDTVFIRAGSYNEQVTPVNSGTAGHEIVYAAWPGETVVLDGSGIWFEYAGVFNCNGVHHIRAERLRAINSASNGFYADTCTYITFHGCYAWNTASSGIGLWKCNRVLVDSCEVENVCTAGDQECITIATTDTFEVRYNHVHDANVDHPKEGICTKDGSTYGRTHHNLVHGNMPVGIYMDAWDKVTHDIEVYQNVVHDCLSGISLASEMGGRLQNIRVYNNVIYHNEFFGINIGGYGGVETHPAHGLTVINNTVYHNGYTWGGGITDDNPNAGGVIIRNNIVSQNLSFQICFMLGGVPESLTVDHNLLDAFRGYEGEVYGSDHVEADPLFTNAAANDFRLLTGSPAINAGYSDLAPVIDFDGFPRPYGTGWDIGAFEYHPATRIVTLLEESDAIRISPNPFREFCWIEVPSGAEWRIVDMQGRTIERACGQWRPSATVPAGLYTLIVTRGPLVARKNVVYLK